MHIAGTQVREAAAGLRARMAGFMGVLLVLASMTVAPPAHAWSAPVHELVCEMAWLQLTPATKRWLRGVRAGEPEQGTFAAGCTWADRVRNGEHRDSDEYHYVNVARGANGFEVARDCPAFDCVPVAVHRYLRYLLAPAPVDRLRQRRARALKFLEHFVADLHQPLHVGYAEDRGGNAIDVAFGRRRENLHALFDGELPAAAGLDDARAAPRLLARIAPADAARWCQGDVDAWADESYQLARDHAYPVAQDGRVTPDEVKALAPLLVTQVQKASVRLAWLLNEAAGGRFALRPLR